MPKTKLAANEIQSVPYGWSVTGHWYATIRTGANGPSGNHIVCTGEEQARKIAEALAELVKEKIVPSAL
jgi:hypothetical protein